MQFHSFFIIVDVFVSWTLLASSILYDTNRNQTLMTTIPTWTMGIKIQLHTALCLCAKYATTPEKSITQLKGPNQGQSRYESRYKNPFNANKRLEAQSLLYKAKKLLKQGTHSFLTSILLEQISFRSQASDLSIEGSPTGPPPVYSFTVSLFCRYTHSSEKTPSVQVKHVCAH